MDKQITYAFTSTNTVLLVNEQFLGGVNKTVIEDVKDNDRLWTRISLQRTYFHGSQELVEIMRKEKFSFKIMNAETSQGWIANNAEMISFKMHLAFSSNDTGIMCQELIIKAPLFTYFNNVTQDAIALKEDEELTNLINILKKNQEAAHKVNHDLKPKTYVVPGAVLPDPPLIKYGVPGNNPETIKKINEDSSKNDYIKKSESKFQTALKHLKNYAELINDDEKSDVRISDEDLVWLNLKPKKLKKKKK